VYLIMCSLLKMGLQSMLHILSFSLFQVTTTKLHKIKEYVLFCLRKNVPKNIHGLNTSFRAG